MDDVTLGKLLTEAHRGQADHREPENMSVSQSSSSMETTVSKTPGQQHHHLSPGSSWKGRVSSSYPGVGSAIFDSLVHFFLIMKMREDRPPPREHSIRETQHAHFEPELTLRQLRGRLCLIHPHRPAYSRYVGVILGDFNMCDPEEGRFNVWN